MFKFLEKPLGYIKYGCKQLKYQWKYRDISIIRILAWLSFLAAIVSASLAVWLTSIEKHFTLGGHLAVQAGILGMTAFLLAVIHDL